ncbi:MAG: protease-like activity factor CPAF [Bdellovibrionales bacterium]|nr:protease-like activity factor CPAF [Bdellovibrionales bacterium]
MRTEMAMKMVTKLGKPQIRAWTFFLSVILSQAIRADSIYQKQTLSTIEFIENVFSSSYAPRDWKAKQNGWNIEDEANKARASVLGLGSDLNIKSAQKILRKLIGSTRDYHVGISFHASERATLPIEIRSAEGKFFIVWIDRDKLPEKSFPLLVGDEITGFNGKPIVEERNQLLAEIDQNVFETDQVLAEMYLTRRVASRGIAVPRGPIELEVTRNKDGKVQTLIHQLTWEYQEEKIKFNSLAAEPTNIVPSIGTRSLASWQMLPGFWKDLVSSKSLNQTNPHMLGARQSFVPSLGQIFWQTEKENKFHAYIFKAEGGGIYGYLRIPSYVAGGEEAKEFLSIVKRMEESTDAMVIDQVNNPGGSVFYLYSLVAMLTDKPMLTPKHRMIITQADVADALETLKSLEKVANEEEAKKVLGATIGGYPVSYQLSQFFKGYMQFIVEQWNQGVHLSSPFYLGIDKIMPHPDGRYTKPILVLINEFDFSGGDFFPAILQDNQRATLLGVRTAGAGGYVNGVEFPNLLGVAGFSFTGSIAERVDLNPIENLGVTPDVKYPLTAEDMKNGFASYKKKIIEQLKLLVAK